MIGQTILHYPDKKRRPARHIEFAKVGGDAKRRRDVFLTMTRQY